MRNFQEELGNVAAEYTKPIANELRHSITNICKYYQLSIDDLCKLFDIKRDYMDEMLKDDSDNDCLFDLRTIGLLTMLSNGRLSVLCDTPSGKMFNDVNCIIKDYQDEKNPPKKETYDWNCKVKQILDLFGVKNSDDLDCLLNNVKNAYGAVEKYLSNSDQTTQQEKVEKKEPDTCRNTNSCNTCENKKKERLYVDANGNFHSQEPFKSETTNNSKINGSYFDSSTMDKPEEFEFTANLDHLIPNLLELIAKNLHVNI